MRTKNLMAIIVGVVLTFIGIAAYAQTPQPYQEYQQIRHEKRALTEWVLSVTKNNRKPLTHSKAKQIIDDVYEYAAIHKADPLLALAMLRNESGFASNARSKYGAKGLMQIVPRFHREKLAGRNPYEVSTNIDVGIQILREYLDQHDNKVRPALRKYSGGARNYYAKISKTHKEMSRFLVTYAFEKEQPITVVHSIDKPRIPPIHTTYDVATR